MNRLRSLLCIFIEISCAIESLRQRLVYKLGLEVAQGFNSIDFNSNGLISRRDIKKSAEIEGIDLAYYHIDAFIRRLDLDQDGSLNLIEFVKGITPLSNLIY